MINVLLAIGILLGTVVLSAVVANYRMEKRVTRWLSLPLDHPELKALKASDPEAYRIMLETRLFQKLGEYARKLTEGR